MREEIASTAHALISGDKGLLAIDESNGTCNKRFARWGIPQTQENRRAYRELIVTTPGLGESISGVILYDETIRQRKDDGTPFVRAIVDAGMIPGIKVDLGAKDLAGHPGEKVTEGLDGLRGRLGEYVAMGARFAKWRAVIAIGEGIPSSGCIDANAQALARYAALCQEVGLVPVVEPEVLMDGDHDLERCRKVTEEVLRAVFDQMYRQRVTLEGMILEAEHGAPRAWLRPASIGGRGGGRHRRVPSPSRARCRSGGGVPFGWPAGRTRISAPECHEFAVRIAAAVGTGVLVRPRHPAAGVGALARRRGSRSEGTASAIPSCQVQRCSAPRRVRRGEGADVVTGRRGAAADAQGLGCIAASASRNVSKT